MVKTDSAPIYKNELVVTIESSSWKTRNLEKLRVSGKLKKYMTDKKASPSSLKPGLTAARDVGLTNLAEDGRSY